MKKLLFTSILTSIVLVTTSCGSKSKSSEEPEDGYTTRTERTTKRSKSSRTAIEKKKEFEYNKTYTFTIKDVGFSFFYEKYRGNYDVVPCKIRKFPGASLTVDFTFYKDHSIRYDVTQKAPAMTSSVGTRNFTVTLKNLLVAGNLDFDEYSEFGVKCKAFALPWGSYAEGYPMIFYTDSSLSEIDETYEGTFMLDWDFDADEFKYEIDDKVLTRKSRICIDENFDIYGDMESLRRKVDRIATVREK